VMMFVSSMAMGVGIAQVNDNDYGVQANIPFAFTVHNTRLPAGNYEIVRVSDVDSVFEIHNADNSVAVLLMADNTKDTISHAQNPEIVFDEIGGQYFMRGLNTEDYGYTYAEPRMEKKLEMQGQKVESHSVQCKHMNMKS
jgi:hypothetical protein